MSQSQNEIIVLLTPGLLFGRTPVVFPHSKNPCAKDESEASALPSFAAMATVVPPQTWKDGYAAPSETATWQSDDYNSTEHGEHSHYTTPPFKDCLSSTAHNSLGLNLVRSWPTIYNGTESPHGIPDWWKPARRVDVLICGGMRAVFLTMNSQKLRDAL